MNYAPDVDVSEVFRQFAAKIGGYNKMVDAHAFKQMNLDLYGKVPWAFHDQLFRRVLWFDKKRKLITSEVQKEINGGCRYSVLLEKQMPSALPDVKAGKLRLSDGTFLDLTTIGNAFFVLISTITPTLTYEDKFEKHCQRGLTRNESM